MKYTLIKAAIQSLTVLGMGWNFAEMLHGEFVKGIFNFVILLIILILTFIKQETPQ